MNSGNPKNRKSAAQARLPRGWPAQIPLRQNRLPLAAGSGHPSAGTRKAPFAGRSLQKQYFLCLDKNSCPLLSNIIEFCLSLHNVIALLTESKPPARRKAPSGGVYVRRPGKRGGQSGFLSAIHRLKQKKPPSKISEVLIFLLVRARGLEPPRVAPPDPKSGASAIPPRPRLPDPKM